MMRNSVLENSPPSAEKQLRGVKSNTMHVPNKLSIELPLKNPPQMYQADLPLHKTTKITGASGSFNLKLEQEDHCLLPGPTYHQEPPRFKAPKPYQEVPKGNSPIAGIISSEEAHMHQSKQSMKGLIDESGIHSTFENPPSSSMAPPDDDQYFP